MTKLGFFRLRRIGGESDPKHREILSHLEKDMVKSEINNLLFNDIPQGKKEHHHYYYRLSTRIAALLDEETLFFDAEASRHFYGFENPTFYSDGEMAACCISHEDELLLYLTEEDINKLEHDGLAFTSLNGGRGDNALLEISSRR